jgi:putative ABC transport system permease protein
MSGSSSSGGARGGGGSMPTLTWEDLRAIQQVPTVRWAAPSLRSSAQVMSEDQNWSTQITGTTPEYFDIRSWRMEHGVRLSDSDVESGAKVVVLGQTVVDKLYGPSADPVGQMVRIRNIPFQVVGVMERKGQSAMGMDYDDAVFIPVSTFRAKIQGGLGKFIPGNVFIGCPSPEATTRAEQQISSTTSVRAPRTTSRSATCRRWRARSRRAPRP